jgi:hypothetical protein
LSIESQISTLLSEGTRAGKSYCYIYFHSSFDDMDY